MAEGRGFQEKRQGHACSATPVMGLRMRCCAGLQGVLDSTAQSHVCIAKPCSQHRSWLSKVAAGPDIHQYDANVTPIQQRCGGHHTSNNGVDRCSNNAGITRSAAMRRSHQISDWRLMMVRGNVLTQRNECTIQQNYWRAERFVSATLSSEEQCQVRRLPKDSPAIRKK